MKTFLYLFMLFLACNVVSAQEKSTEHISQAWLSYFNQTRLSNRWGVSLDLQVRMKEKMVSNLGLGIVSGGIIYYVNDLCKLSAGYMFINHFPTQGHTNSSRPEHRPWQQLQWHNRYSKIRTMQWFRLEQRFRKKIANDELIDGYNFNFRARYLMQVQYPLSKKRFNPGSFAGVAINEILINFGKEIKYNYFDQNRFFLGFSYQTTPRNHLLAGYTNIFQQLPSGNQFRMFHVARFSLFHNIDYRNKK